MVFLFYLSSTEERRSSGSSEKLQKAAPQNQNKEFKDENQ